MIGWFQAKTEIGDQGGTGHFNIPAINGEPRPGELNYYDYKSTWALCQHNKCLFLMMLEGENCQHKTAPLLIFSKDSVGCWLKRLHDGTKHSYTQL